MLPVESIDNCAGLWKIFSARLEGLANLLMQFASEAWRLETKSGQIAQLGSLVVRSRIYALLDITIIYRHRDAYWWEMAKKSLPDGGSL